MFISRLIPILTSYVVFVSKLAKRIILPYTPVYMKNLVPKAGVSDTDYFISMPEMRASGLGVFMCTSSY